MRAAFRACRGVGLTKHALGVPRSIDLNLSEDLLPEAFTRRPMNAAGKFFGMETSETEYT